MPKIEVLVGNHKITLSDKEYRAAGGEGTIYIKNNAVYKIYHDINHVIPELKIQELQVLSHLDNVIIPNKSIMDQNTGKRIGYVMRFVDDTEALCKLFVSNFRQDNNISPDMVQALVKKLQETLLGIHNAGIVVGDYNEMNFLVDDAFKIPYYIDTDSYQTKSFKCQVIMDSVRDRKYPMGDFRQESDWFSWGIVSFQLYTGIHPYKGKHPNFKPNDFDGRMKAGFTVFDKAVSVPKFVNLNAIPRRHLDWYKATFINGERTPPPFADATGFIQIIRNVVNSTTSQIDAVLYYKYPEKIVHVVQTDFCTFVLTRTGLYRDKSEVESYPNGINGKAFIGYTNDLTPVVSVLDKKTKTVHFFDKHEKIGSYNSSDIMACNGCMYSISNVGLVEHEFDKLGKVFVTHKTVATVHPLSTKLFEGIAVQELYGKASIAVPYMKGHVANLHVPELDGYTIIDAKRVGHVAMFIGEKKGKYDCITLILDKASYTSYISAVETDVDQRVANFTIKSTGLVVVCEYDNSVKMFVDFKKAQIISNTPMDETFPIFGNGNVHFVNYDQIYIAKTK